MKWNLSDAQERQGVGLADALVSMVGQIFREQTVNDVGIDAHVELVEASNSTATGQLVALQIKSGPSFFSETTDTGVIFRGSLEHLNYWLDHSLPVFLVLIDTVKQKGYWEEITEEMIERLPKGWKIEVPFANDLETNFVVAARNRIGLEPNSAIYTRLALDDTSNATTKRYAAGILVRHPITRLRLEAVIRRATAEIRKETFHRTERLSQQFGDQEADVVSLFLAGDPGDAATANWLARTMWINPKMNAANRPHAIGGIDLGDGLQVVWSSDYNETGQFLKTLEIDKQSYLEKVKQIATATERLIAETFGGGDKVIADRTSAQRNVDAMNGLYLASPDIGAPPYECRDVATRFEDVMALAHNAFMEIDPARMLGNNTGVNVPLESALRDCRKNLDRLQYEIEKVT